VQQFLEHQTPGSRMQRESVIVIHLLVLLPVPPTRTQ
jgi:hypothetical protein